MVRPPPLLPTHTSHPQPVTTNTPTVRPRSQNRSRRHRSTSSTSSFRFRQAHAHGHGPAQGINHFAPKPIFEPFHHRPHKTLALLVHAFAATAIFHIWPHMLFYGGFSAMVVVLKERVHSDITVPTTMLTPLGVVLGLVLSYRTSSAYERYMEGRRYWADIVTASRNWARYVWVHGPDVLNPDDLHNEDTAREAEEVRSIIEKRTIVQLGLAFAIAVKHYLRGEEGIMYDDLYDLVRFLPAFSPPDPPSSLASLDTLIEKPRRPPMSRDPSLDYLEKHGVRLTGKPQSISIVTPPRSKPDSPLPPFTRPASLPSSPTVAQNPTQTQTDAHPRVHYEPPSPVEPRVRAVPLQPAHNPPAFRWSETFPVRYFVTRHQQEKAEGRAAMRRRMRAHRSNRGVGQNVPLEIQLYMAAWLTRMQQRGTMDGNACFLLMYVIESFADSLAGLDRVLTTPIPWTYQAHIMVVTWAYCLFLPFQLVETFGWVTVPATLVTVYTIFGFAAIGEEIENPFGYDKNDLDLEFLCDDVIRREIDALTARPILAPEEWVFSRENHTVGGWAEGKTAREYTRMDKEGLREVLARRGQTQQDDGEKATEGGRVPDVEEGGRGRTRRRGKQ